MIDISNILGKKEGLHLEAKSARGGFPDSFWESYSAFANTDGGVILLGVEEKPDHSLYVTDGLTDAEKMKNDFWNMVNNRQKVSHNIVTNSMVYVVQIEGKNILVVEVPRAERTIRQFIKVRTLATEHFADGMRATIFVLLKKLEAFFVTHLFLPLMPRPLKIWI